jgi:hypothetical protein
MINGNRPAAEALFYRLIDHMESVLKNSVLHRGLLGAFLAGGMFVAGCGKDETPNTSNTNSGGDKTVAPGGAASLKPGMTALVLQLPKFAYEGTPKGKEPEIKLEPENTPQITVGVPAGCVNLALNKKVTASSDPINDRELSIITDGSKENRLAEVLYAEFGAGTQWVQIDLEKSSEIYGIAIWHMHTDPRIAYGMIVQVSDDPEFKKDVTTLYNNDQLNICELGVGKELGYKESRNGRLIDAKGTKARYVRVYGRGTNVDDQTQFTEIEAWGVPAK